jgi:hypothetical protein
MLPSDDKTDRKIQNLVFSKDKCTDITFLDNPCYFRRKKEEAEKQIAEVEGDYCRT